MKIAQVNTTCGAGSTGKICVAVSELLSQAGIENHILYTVGHNDHPAGIKYMSAMETKLQALKSRIFGNYGFQSKNATRRLIAELDRIGPDIVHLHNLHGHNVHLGILFSYLKEKNTKVFWTFHDCWAFTGYCPYYDIVNCNRWQTGCCKCPQKAKYSWFFDRSSHLFAQKKQLFAGLDLTIITPSQWLADQLKMSFLKDYPVKVIHNGIDLSVFSPKESSFRAQHGIGDRFLVLGVAFGWGVRKGLDVFIRLAQRLDPEKFQIVLVGTDDAIDKQLPANIISIHRTKNQTQLAEIYTAADLFVNPSREDTFPTTHMEALACGTPVLTFNTGGCAEMLNDKCGFVVNKDDVDGLAAKIISVCDARLFPKEDCIARSKDFAQQQKFKEYICLYE